MQRVLKILTVAVAPLLLLSCYLTPGKFVSALDISRDGNFVFTYKGEFILVTSQSVTGEEGTPPQFAPKCTDDAGDSRACTNAETVEQKRKFDEEQTSKSQQDAKNRQEMASMLGGIDPGNEKSMEDFAARLQREVGWRKVVHRGKGVFDVDYEMRGRLDRDFVFPIFPRFNFIVPAVVVSRRDDNALLVRAPAFGGSNGGADAAGPLGPLGAGGSKADGVFTLTTDADIATNNSEEGAVTVGNRKRLEWRVTPLDHRSPEALLRLAS